MSVHADRPTTFLLHHHRSQWWQTCLHTLPMSSPSKFKMHKLLLDPSSMWALCFTEQPICLSFINFWHSFSTVKLLIKARSPTNAGSLLNAGFFLSNVQIIARSPINAKSQMDVGHNIPVYRPLFVYLLWNRRLYKCTVKTKTLTKTSTPLRLHSMFNVQ